MPLALRPIEPRDDAAVAHVIRTVMPELGASGPGFAIVDPEVDAMCAAYTRPAHAYFVVVDDDDQVVGGAGVAPLAGGDAGVCELRKMYILSTARGGGVGRRLLTRCLDEARALGFTRCYLETLTGMDAAMHLYESCGFARLDGPLGATGHFGCNRWYLLDFDAQRA
jgi:putative acetyltransferase